MPSGGLLFGRSDAPDEEFDMLHAAVSKFEKTVGQSRDLPGYVPTFHEQPVAHHGRLDNFGMDMMVKRMIVLKDDGKLPGGIGDGGDSQDSQGTGGGVDGTGEGSGDESEEEDNLPTFPSMALANISGGAASNGSGSGTAGGLAINIAASAGGRVGKSATNADRQKLRAQIDTMRADTGDGGGPADEEQDIVGFADYDFSQAEYRLTVLTSNRPGAGTDAKIWVDCHGDLGSTGRCMLVGPVSGAAKAAMFQRGSKDVFKMLWPNLGKIRKLQIGHDNSGRHPGWMLDTMLIEDMSKKMEKKHSSLRWTFRCNRWFDKHDGDGLIARWLLPLSMHGDAAADSAEKPELVSWDVESVSSRASSAAAGTGGSSRGLHAVRAAATLGLHSGGSSSQDDSDGQHSAAGSDATYYSSENEGP